MPSPSTGGEPAGESRIDRMLAMVGERKKVLDVGCGNGHFASLLTKRQCDVDGVEPKPSAAEEARRYCAEVAIADLDRESLGGLFASAGFDVIVFGDVLARLREPVRTLDEARQLIAQDGYVVASIPNVSHGAIRLALLSGNFDYGDLGFIDDTHVRFFTAKSVEELFVGAGYSVETIERVNAPIFGESAFLPKLALNDFDANVVSEILADPESETLHFVIKALPLSNDQRLQALTKRFLVANTELAESRRQLTRRAQDVAKAEEDLQVRDATIARLREEVADANALASTAQADVRRLEAECRKLEADGAAILERRTDAVVERLVAAQAQHAQVLETADRLRVELYESTRAREALEAQLRDLGPAADEERYVAAFETEFEAQRRLTEAQQRLSDIENQLSKVLQTSREDIERERGRVLSLESELRDEERRADWERNLRAELEPRAAEALALKAELDDARGALENARSSAEAVTERLQMELGAERSLRAEIEMRAAQAADRVAELERARDDFERTQVSVESAFESLRGELGAERAARGELEWRAACATAEIAELRGLSEGLNVARSEAEFALERVRSDLEAERALRSTFEKSATESASHVAKLEEARDALEAARAAAERRIDLALAESKRASADRDTERIANTRRIAELGRERDAALSVSVQVRGQLDSVVAELEAERELRGTLDIGVAAHLARIADLEDERGALEDARADAEAVCDRALAQLESALAELETERAARDEIGNLRSELVAERSMRAEVEAYAARLQEEVDEQAAYSLDLETKATAILAHARANAAQLEEAWFAMYAELDEARGRLAHLADVEETLLAVRADTAERTERHELALSQAHETLEKERGANETLKAESERLRSLWRSTYAVIREGRGRVDALAAELVDQRLEGERLVREMRDRADALAAEAAALHLHVAQAEATIKDLEHKLLQNERHGQRLLRDVAAKQEKLDEGANYARHLEAEIAATRKAALAERIVMRDYADEIRSRSEEQTRLHLEQIAHLTERVHHGARALEDLRTTSESNIQKLQAQIASVTAYGAEMRELLAGAERRLLDQTEDTIANMQAESAQLVQLVDTVQSSHFWKVKRWLSRLLARNRR